MTKIIVELPTDEAKALAQLVKHLGYDDAERLSSRYDGEFHIDAAAIVLLVIKRSDTPIPEPFGD
jgi:hypothetical protein